jgi:hypothetical protein
MVHSVYALSFWTHAHQRLSFPRRFLLHKTILPKTMHPLLDCLFQYQPSTTRPTFPKMSLCHKTVAPKTMRPLQDLFSKTNPLPQGRLFQDRPSATRPSRPRLCVPYKTVLSKKTCAKVVWTMNISDTQFIYKIQEGASTNTH